jgi:hypothetical protein
MTAQRAAEANLIFCRFACSDVSLWFSPFFLQVPKDNSPQTQEGLEIQPSQVFE